VIIQLYSEPLQRFRLAAQGHGAVQPPERDRERIATYFDPLPIWYQPFEEATAGESYPLHAVTQRPMHMYHSWGSQNAWLRQITARNFLYMNRATAEDLGLADGDWVTVTSPHGRIKAPLRVMEGCGPHTVWTWNAIGKRSAAWGLDADAPESKKGFLLNHLIPELLPPDKGYRHANADPITGQAAWYDLRVRVEKADAADETSRPQFPPAAATHRKKPAVLRYGAKLRAGHTQ
jgi:anaerobic selenocysteine-containing dehydrogenase